MDNIGIGLFLLGILVGLAGIGGFVDTRKVDRRFKTGYKNNEPDTRNFGRAGKRVLYGIGICIVGSAVVHLASPSQPSAPATAVDSATSEPATTVAASDVPSTAASNPVVALDPQQPQSPADSGVVLGNNERVVTTDAAMATTDSAPEAPVVQAANVSTQGNTETSSCSDDGSYFGANVCRSATLAAAYGQEIKEYEAAQERIGGNDVGVRIEQEKWLDQVKKSCTDMPCLTNAFDDRIANLHSRYRKDS
jgi:hypothetical protein